MISSHIAISGELGSGKSTVAQIVGKELGLDVIGSGDVQRGIAKSMGLSTLQMNWLAEEKAAIDAEIDGALAAMVGKPAAILDARLAWHFVPDSFKVHLIVDPVAGADRLLRGRYSAVEAYKSVEDAEEAAEARYKSERRRFLSKYSIDISRLRNYDLILDTTDAKPAEVAAEIVRAMRNAAPVDVPLRLSPRRVIPAGNAAPQVAAPESDQPFPRVGYDRPFFFCISGFGELSAALASHAPLMPAYLEAEQEEIVGAGMTAHDYLIAEARLSWINDWENAHDFRFQRYPELASS